MLEESFDTSLDPIAKLRTGVCVALQNVTLGGGPDVDGDDLGCWEEVWVKWGDGQRTNQQGARWNNRDR